MRHAFLALLLWSSTAQANPQRVQSGATRVSVLELYSSEGCSSCPPADELVNSLPSRAPGQLVALAFHVDYWDDIGWPDPFASPRWTARQRARSASVYTPELMLNGHEIGRSQITLPDEPASAQLELEYDGGQATLRARGGRRLFLAVTESELVVRVGAGENRGRTLRHDHVVRELFGPFDAGRAALQPITLSPKWNRAHLALVAFVEDERGEIVNAVRLPLARE